MSDMILIGYTCNENKEKRLASFNPDPKNPFANLVKVLHTKKNEKIYVFNDHGKLVYVPFWMHEGSEKACV